MQKCDFREIFFKKVFHKNILVFLISFFPRFYPLCLSFEKIILKSTFLNALLRKYFAKKFVFLSLFLSMKKSSFFKILFFHENHKNARESKRDFKNWIFFSFLKLFFIFESFLKKRFFARKKFFVFFMQK